MDAFDFFFPEQAQASHLRKIAAQKRLDARTARSGASASEVDELREDVGFLSMVVMAMLKRLAETETLSLGDVKDLFEEIDGLDGSADGGLDVGVLRGLLGVLRASENPEDDDSKGDEFPEIDIVTTPRYRR